MVEVYDICGDIHTEEYPIDIASEELLVNFEVCGDEFQVFADFYWEPCMEDWHIIDFYNSVITA